MTKSQVDAKPDLDQAVDEAIQAKMQGGAIRKPKRRSPKKIPKIEEALEKKMQGGAIRKPKKRSPKKIPKIEEALEKKMQGGAIRFHDAMHKHLHNNLSGRGGRFDSALVREKMHQVMSRYHPALFQSYLSGQVRDIPTDRQYHLGGPIKPVRRDPRPTIINTGGSMSSLTHSENGVLQAHDSTFYQNYELV